MTLPGQEQCNPFAELLSSLSRVSSMLSIFTDESSDVHVKCLALCLSIAVLCFTVSSLTDNVSQVDKLWSIAPCLYAWIAVRDTRTFIMALLATSWGARLSYNFYRRGGYTFPYIWRGDEDYRWPALRSGNLPYFGFLRRRIPWIVFNLIFISLYQNILLLLIVSPSLVVWSAATYCPDTTPPFDVNGWDGVAIFLFVLFLCIETIADNQQWKFQTEKYKRIHANQELAGDYKDGFCQSGLFAIVRKPNYASEQAIWISYYLFSVAALNGSSVNWSMVGWVLLVLLFQGSGWITELLTERRHPSYAKYKERVPLYVPCFFSPALCVGKSRTKLKFA